MNFETNDGQKVALTGLVNDPVLSQEDMPQTRRTVLEISRETDIQLRCYDEVTTTSLVFAFYWNTEMQLLECQKIQHT